MSSSDVESIVSEYFQRLEAALAGLPGVERDQLLAEIREHVAQARAGLATESPAAIQEVLDRVGRPEEIAREALGDRVQGRPRRRFVLAGAAVLAVVAVAVVLALVLDGSSRSPAGSAGPAARTASVGGFPTGIAYDPVSRTVYVASGEASDLTMLDAQTCNADTTSGCAQPRTVSTGGSDAIGVVVDDQTRTVYAVNGGTDTVAVIDARTCNAHETSGCGRTPVLVHLPAGPEFLALDEKTNTVYVADTDAGQVSMIAGNACDAENHAGCAKSPATVPVGSGPFPIAVDEASNTIYVGTLSGGGGAAGGDVSVVDGSRCDSMQRAGCATAPARLTAGSGPAGIALDPGTDTLYVSSEDGTVSVVDARSCNGSVRSGCGKAAATVSAQSDPRGDAFDPATNTLYVTNGGSNTVSMIDTSKCNASSRSSCSGALASFPVGGSPRRLALDPDDHTLYVVNTLGGSVSLIDTRTCNAGDQRGCPTEPAAGTAAAGGPLAAGPASDSTCWPTTAAASSGGSASTLTAGARQVGAGTTDGVAWTLWSKKGESGANALENAGLVVNGRAYGLCPGYPNPAELELLDAGGKTIAFGVIGYPGAAKLKLTTGTTGTFTPGTPLPTPTVHRINGVSFFIGALPKSPCSYPALELDSTSGKVSAEHNLGFGSCTTNKLLPITFSQGIWQLQAGHFVNNFGSGPSASGFGSNLVTTMETCSPGATSSESGSLAQSLIRGATRLAAGTIAGHHWSLWASKATTGTGSVENGGLVLDGRWYGLCPGPPNPAEFELIDLERTAITYGYVANPGPYAITLTPGRTLPRSALHRVRGGTFFIATLPRLACSYPNMQLTATTPSVRDLRYQSFGSCERGKLVEVSGGHGEW